MALGKRIWIGKEGRVGVQYKQGFYFIGLAKKFIWAFVLSYVKT